MVFAMLFLFAKTLLLQKHYVRISYGSLFALFLLFYPFALFTASHRRHVGAVESKHRYSHARQADGQQRLSYRKVLFEIDSDYGC